MQKEAVKSINSEDIFNEDEYARLISIFKERHSKAVLYADNEDESKRLLSKFISESKKSFSKIIYARYDRNKYLYNNDMKHLGLDTVLKKCLSRSFIEKETDFSGIECNYFSQFERVLDENTLLIIDDFDVAAPTPYMRHLLSHDCSLLIVSRCPINSIPKDIPVIGLKKGFDRSKSDIESKISSLNPKQKELLITLCGMLRYLDDDTEIESSKSGIFDRESVKFYLGDLYMELCELEKSQLIGISESGKITLIPDVLDYVLSVLTPCADNCKALMKFINKICGFSVMQNYKDIYARLVTQESVYSNFVSSQELRDVYACFCKSDKNSGRNIYNMLTSMMLDRNALHKGSFNCRHLLWNNRCYYLSLAAEFLRDKTKSKGIYNNELYLDESPSDIYSHSIKAELDIIRFCVTLLRNTTSDLYKESEYIFELLLSAMNKIYKETDDSSFNDCEKAEVLDNVIQLCIETFGYSRVFDDDGSYFGFRDNMQNSRIFYTCEKECDSLHASSVLMGYSSVTLWLYSVFQKYISKYLELTKSSYENPKSLLLTQYTQNKNSFYRQIYSDISVNYMRITNGFNKHCDFLSQSNKTVMVWKCSHKEDIEKTLADNKRYLTRGFDGGTKSGADKYSSMIINAVTNSDEPLRVILPIFDVAYPVGDYTYKALSDKKFVNIVCSNERLSNLTKQILIESLIYSYSEYGKKSEKNNLCSSLICSLDECISHNSTSLQRLYHAASTAFAENKLFELSNTHDLDKMTFSDFSAKLYKRYCVDIIPSEIYAYDCVSDILYSIVSGEKKSFNKKKLFKAIKILIFEGNCVIYDGLEVLAKELLSKNDADEIISLLKNNRKTHLIKQ